VIVSQEHQIIGFHYVNLTVYQLNLKNL
jgi:hypothetical protein